jgi:carboxyl-terminal processing protease
MPDPYQYIYPKEKDEDYPLAWDKITPASYKVWNHSPDVSYLSEQSSKRTGNDSIFNLIRDEAKNFKNERDSQLYSLNLDEYRKAEKQRTENNKRYEPISKALPFESVLDVTAKGMLNVPKDTTKHKSMAPVIAGNYTVLISATTGEKNKMLADTNEAKSENTWLKRLTKDPELFEATRVIGDMK